VRQPETRPLRVAWLSPIPRWAAVEARRRGEAPDIEMGFDAVRACGIEPTLIDPLPWPWNPWRNGHSLHAGIDPLRTLGLAPRLGRYDVIFSDGESSVLGLLALKPLLRFRAPVVVWDPAIGGGWRLRQRSLAFALPRVDRILLVGSNQESWLLRHMPGAAPARAIQHWVDTDFFAPAPPPRDGYVLSVGNDLGRDFATLIEAVRDLGVAMRLRTDLPVAAPLPEAMELLRERASFAALRNLYAGAGVVVVPVRDTVHASGVNGVLEAMAMGRPLVATRSAGLADFLRDGETCLTVPPGDAAALRAAIGRLRGDAELAARLGAAARQDAEARFGLAPFAERLAAELWAVHRDHAR